MVVVADGATVCMRTGGAQPPVSRVTARGVVMPNLIVSLVTGSFLVEDGARPG